MKAVRSGRTMVAIVGQSPSGWLPPGTQHPLGFVAKAFAAKPQAWVFRQAVHNHAVAFFAVFSLKINLSKHTDE